MPKEVNCFADIRHLMSDLPSPDSKSKSAAIARQNQLTKPAGALGRMESLAIWLAGWQGTPIPRTDEATITVFAGNHGVCAHGVSAYPPEVTAQMVANFESGGAAINQMAAILGARLKVVPLDLEQPTADFTIAPAMTESETVEAFVTGMVAVSDCTDLLVVGEMGIGNTTVAAAIACALFGGEPQEWAGPGTGLDDTGQRHKAAVIEQALALHQSNLNDPLAVLSRLGGREVAAMAGALLEARIRSVPVVLDGYVCGAAAAVLHAIEATALNHCVAGHVSAEPGHKRLLDALGAQPLLDLGMRLGEGTGAATAVSIIRIAAACHAGMATFDEAKVAGPANA